MRFAAVLLILAAPALAQELEIQRALMQRDQQSVEFALNVRHSQAAILAGAGDNRHLHEKQSLENLSERQLQSIQNGTRQELRPYERQKAADERWLVFPPPAVHWQAAPMPRPLAIPKCGPIDLVTIGEKSSC